MRARAKSLSPRVRVAALLAGFALAISAGGCDNQNDIAPEPASGGAGGSGGITALACPSGLPGPGLVKVETSQGVTYCMDQREVTFAEYRAFLTAKAGNTASQPSECSWNTTFQPEYQAWDDHTSPGWKCPSGSEPTSEQQAANCIDFCDALGYCEWAGKRLCGRIGGPSGNAKVDVASAPIPDTSMEFVYACTQANKTTYPYGDAYEAGRCIDPTWVAQKGTNSLAVTDLSNRACHGVEPPFDQIYDLSGSVREWQNVCGTSSGMTCLNFGGGWGDKYDTSNDLSCTGGSGFLSAQQHNPGVGFRCCADGVPVSNP